MIFAASFIQGDVGYVSVFGHWNWTVFWGGGTAITITSSGIVAFLSVFSTPCFVTNCCLVGCQAINSVKVLAKEKTSKVKYWNLLIWVPQIKLPNEEPICNSPTGNLFWTEGTNHKDLSDNGRCLWTPGPLAFLICPSLYTNQYAGKNPLCCWQNWLGVGHRCK